MFRLTFIPVGCVSEPVITAQVAANMGRRLVEHCAPHGRPLAIVGGGPSVLDVLDELKAWPGDIWAINNTAAWLAKHGIRSTLLSVDPDNFEFDKTGVADALLASCCHPKAFDGLNVSMFHMIEHDPSGVAGGTSTASRAPALALRMGYFDMTFFGCEGSFVEADHVDRDEQKPEQLIIRAGADYKTTPPLLLQCECLSDLIREFPCFHEKSGGLLRAMVKHPDWEVVAVSGALKQNLIETNGDIGLYESKYEVTP